MGFASLCSRISFKGIRLTMLRQLPVFIAMALAAMGANANDLKQLYELALTRDASLQSAGFQRDAAIESRPQALALWLPQISANASATRERAGFDSAQLGNGAAADCALTAAAGTQYCYGTVHGLGLNLSQTLWSFQAFSQLKEANFAAAAAETAYQGARQSLLLRVAQAYFAILSAADQLATNRSERDAFAVLLSQAKTREKTGVGPRSDVEQAQAFYDATDQGVIDAQNALDDANLALSEIVDAPIAGVASLRADIPLTSPEPDSADEWVMSARQDNYDVRTAALKMEAAERDISAQRGRGLPTFALTGSSSKVTQDEVLGGNETLNMVGVSFTWPLFQGGAVASAVRQSRALYRQAQAAYDSTQRDAERQTRAAFRNTVSGIQRIGAAQRAVESGAKAVEASRRNVEFGTGTEFELLDAQNNYFTARRAYSQTRYDYLTSVLTLKQQAGRLTEQDLIAIDDLLIEKSI
jgi:outer membrane protein